MTKQIGLNAYGNKVGVHSPDMSYRNKKLIEEGTGLVFIDSSWHNDACDSISNVNLDLQIFLPNSEVEDDGVTYLTTFVTSCFSDCDSSRYSIDKAFTLEEVIEFIINLKK